ncbi:hypothetical protein [Heliobacterium mobile]|uniref:hypothetical protein n=1 Tax=Heliobacterium mobile TaxID=28064 RepID=UPI001478B89F|nr:hypothetical protein [Heliobacterium mobile]
MNIVSVEKFDGNYVTGSGGEVPETAYYKPLSPGRQCSPERKSNRIWNEGSWTYIEYTVTGSNTKKRGYVPTTTVNVTESISTITNQNIIRYVNTSGTTYTGPASSGYATAGSLTRGEKVTYIG